MVACFAAAMDNVHDRERVPPTDDAEQVLDAAVTRGRVRGARVGASTRRDVARGDIQWAGGHRRNVASGRVAGKRGALSCTYLPRRSVTDTFGLLPGIAHLSVPG